MEGQAYRTHHQISDPSKPIEIQNQAHSHLLQTTDPVPIQTYSLASTPPDSTESAYSYAFDTNNSNSELNRAYERANSELAQKNSSIAAPASVNHPPSQSPITQQVVTPGYPPYNYVPEHPAPYSSDYSMPSQIPYIRPPPSLVGPPPSHSHAPVTGRHRKGKKYPEIEPHAQYSLETIFPSKPWDFSDFDASKWSKTFNKYSSQVKGRFDVPSKCCRVMRIHVMLDTVTACTYGYYHGAGGSIFTRLLEETLAESSEAMDGQMVKEKAKTMMPPVYAHPEKRVFVVNGDSLDVGLVALKTNMKTCVLSLGNAVQRGGGWKSGAGAQEESLFRRTNLYRRLCDPAEVSDLEARLVDPKLNVQQWTRSKAYKRISQDSTIYTRDAIVFRDSEANGYSYMSTPTKIDILTACAIKRDRPDPLTAEEEDQTLDTIRNIFGRAIIEGCECIVLGALGCGAFNNPPQTIAKLFHQALFENGYAQLFKIVVFAIIEDHNSAHGNLQPFSSTFQGKPHSLSSFSKAMMSSMGS